MCQEYLDSIINSTKNGAFMSLHNLATHLAAHGRGNDKMLMHVTPSEVAGLQSIAMAAGGSLSINPHTGLPEAGFFDFLGNMLPQIVGTAVGTAVGGPYGAYIGAGTAGALQTAKTGNLMSGVMAGLGAYGGANLFQGVANAAPAAGANAAGSSGAGTVGSGIGTFNPAYQNASGTLNMGATPAGAEAFANAPVGTAIEGGTGTTTSFAGAPAATNPGTTLGTMSSKAPLTWENFKAGVQNIMGDGGIKSLQTGLGAEGFPLTGTQLASRAAMPIAQMAMSGIGPQQMNTEDNSALWGKYTPLSEYRKRYKNYAEGGPTYGSGGGPDFYGNGIDTSRANLNFDKRDRPLGEPNSIEGGYTNMDARDRPYNEPNKVEGGYASGGYLDGPGDGMSDSIPATIEGKQPAKLADGEFVIPADVVSHLGNGSTKAGAKRLYEMMANVRRARTGNHKQGKQINPNRFIPT